MASKQKAEVVAGKSKSAKNKENSKETEDVDASADGTETEVPEAESIEDTPVIIEGEAVEVEASEGASTDSEDVREETASSGEDESVAETSAKSVEDVLSSDNAETTASLPAAPAESSASAGPSVLALVFGGIIAGAIGYFGAALAPKPDAPVFDSTELTTAIDGNTATLTELGESVASLENVTVPEVDLSGIEGQLGSLSQSLETLTADLGGVQAKLDDVTQSFVQRATELDERIVALETAVPAAGELATGDELGALRARIEEMMAETETRLAEAQAEAAEIARAAAETRATAEAEAAEVAAAAAAREAEVQAMTERQETLLELQTAVASGASYADLLEPLGAVPDALSMSAETGVPTIQSLQGSFPAVAREALAQSVIVPEDASTGERLTAFLKRRTNARSLTPQDGDGPDAVLSRAEASLGGGDLVATLAELDALPEVGQAAMADWLQQARARVAALAAIEELTATN